MASKYLKIEDDKKKAITLNPDWKDKLSEKKNESTASGTAKKSKTNFDREQASERLRTNGSVKRRTSSVSDTKIDTSNIPIIQTNVYKTSTDRLKKGVGSGGLLASLMGQSGTEKRVVTGNTRFDNILYSGVFDKSAKGRVERAKMQNDYFARQLKPLEEMGARIEKDKDYLNTIRQKYATDKNFRTQYDGLMEVYNLYQQAAPIIEKDFNEGYDELKKEYFAEKRKSEIGERNYIIEQGTKEAYGILDFTGAVERGKKRAEKDGELLPNPTPRYINGEYIGGESIDQMSEYERNAYYALYGENPSKALAFKKAMGEKYTDEWYQKETEGMKKKPVTRALSMVAADILKYPEALLNIASGGKLFDSGYKGFGNFSNEMWNQLDNSFEGEVGKIAAGTTRALGDIMSAAIVAGGSPKLARALMSVNGGSEAMKSARERGGSDAQVLASGVANVVIEYLSEKTGAEKLLGMIGKPAKSIIKAMGISGGSELFEETISQFAQNISDMAMMGDKSNYILRKNELMQSGMSSEDASKQTLKELLWEQPLDGGIVGFFTGAIFGGGNALYSTLSAGSYAIKEGNKFDTYIDGLINADASDYNGKTVQLQEQMQKYKADFENSSTKFGKIMSAGKAMAAASEFNGISKVAATHEISEGNRSFLNALSKAANTNILYTEIEQEISDDGEGYKAGYFVPGTNTVVIDYRATAADIFELTAGHEVGHSIEGSKYYEAFKAKAIEDINAENKDSGKTFDDLVREKAKKYADAGEKITKSAAESEVIADYIGKVINDNSLAERMAKRDYGTARLIVDKVKDVYGKVESFFNPDAKKGIGETIRLLERAVGMRNAALIGEGVVQYAIDKNFVNNYNKWVLNGKKNGVRILVGNTSEALKSIGVKNQNIYWDSSKVNNTLVKHSGYMTDEIIKQVPEIIENPIIVMQSKNKDSRLTMFGEVYDNDGLPIMAVIELLPTNLKKGYVLDEIKIVSSHSRKNINSPADMTQTQSIINTSDILYIDPNKKRTDNWLVANRLQLPLHITHYGSIKRVTYPDGNVNTYSTQNLEKDAYEKTEFQIALEKAGIDNDTFKESASYSIENLTPEQVEDLNKSEGLTDEGSVQYHIDDTAMEMVKIHKVKMYTFPSYKESGSDTNEIATRWAHNDEIETSGQTLVFHRNQCYLIEKYDDSELGYQIVGRINYKEYQDRVRRLDENGRKNEKQRLAGRIVDNSEFGGQGSVPEGRKQSTDNNSVKFSGETTDIYRMAENEISGGEFTDNGSGDNERNSTDRKAQSIGDASYSIENLTLEQVEAVRKTGSGSREKSEQYGVMWTIEDNTLSKREVSAFYGKISEMHNNKYSNYKISKDGEYIFSAGNKLIYSDGEYNYPTISKVITFDTQNETLIDYARECLYEYEQQGLNFQDAFEIIEIMYGEKFVTHTDFKDSRANGGETAGRTGKNSGTFNAGSGKNVSYSIEQLTPEQVEAVKKAESGRDVVSEFYKNSLQKEVVTPAVKAADAPERHKYRPISNEETYKRGRAYVEEAGFERAKAELEDKFDAGIPLSSEEVGRAEYIFTGLQKAGNTFESVRFAEKWNKSVTEGARALQALKILDRLTPEGKLLYVTRQAGSTTDKQVSRLKGKKKEAFENDAAEAKKEDARVNELIRKLREDKAEFGEYAELMQLGKDEVDAKLEEYVKEIEKLNAEIRKGEKKYTELREKIKKGTNDSLEIEAAEEKNKLDSLKKRRETLTATETAIKREREGKSELDKVYEKYGIDHLSEGDREYIAELLQRIDGLETKEDFIDLILEQNKKRERVNPWWLKKNLEKTDIAFLKDTAWHQVIRMVQDKESTSFAEKVRTTRVMAMLMNLRTFFRNIVSNFAFSGVDATATNIAVIFDAIMSKHTKQRTVAADNYGFSKSSQKAMSEGARKSAIEIALDVQSGESKYGLGKKAVFKNRGMSALERGLGYSLQTTDVMSEEGIKRTVADGLMKLREKGKAKFTDDEIAAYAEEVARYRTFKDENGVSKAINKIRDALNFAGFKAKDGEMAYGVGDFVLPFVQVPGAIVMRSMEYSPVGYLKMIKTISDIRSDGGLTAENQRKVALTLGRATTGLGLTMAFALLSNMGIVKGSQDDEDEEKRAKALANEQGLTGFKLNSSALGRVIKALFTKGDVEQAAKPQDGDTLVGYDFLEPISNNMAVGYAVSQAQEGGFNLIDTGAITTAKFFDQIMDTTGFDTVEKMLDSETDIKDKIITLGVDYGMSFVPRVVTQAAQAFDPVYRNVYNEGDKADVAKARVINSIPGLRNSLPAKVNSFGSEVSNTTGSRVLDFMNAFINPGTVSKYRTNDVIENVWEVYNSTGESDVLPSNITSGKNTAFGGGAKVNLYGHDFADYKKEVGTSVFNAYEKVMSSEEYKKADYGKRALMLSEAKDTAQTLANIAFDVERVNEYVTEKGVMTALSDGTHINLEPEQYMAALGNAKSDFKEKYKYVTGTDRYKEMSDKEKASALTAIRNNTIDRYEYESAKESGLISDKLADNKTDIETKKSYLSSIVPFYPDDIAKNFELRDYENALGFMNYIEKRGALTGECAEGINNYIAEHQKSGKHQEIKQVMLENANLSDSRCAMEIDYKSIFEWSQDGKDYILEIRAEDAVKIMRTFDDYLFQLYESLYKNGYYTEKRGMGKVTNSKGVKVAATWKNMNPEQRNSKMSEYRSRGIKIMRNTLGIVSKYSYEIEKKAWE